LTPWKISRTTNPSRTRTKIEKSSTVNLYSIKRAD
jgi:hypothetical protein